MLIKTASLPQSILHIIEHKGTERPFTGKYTDVEVQGTYLCRRCGLALFRASSKFHSGCGWPSFDDEITGSIKREPDADGRRTEILCARCDAHLGHVFQGEGHTTKNLRHCVNSASIDFVADVQVTDTEEAIFAGGCFWGVEHYFKQLPGVLKTEVGYAGGHKEDPTYQQVCAKTTGHLEVLRVVYDIAKTDYQTVTQYFLEIHDPTQTDGQGPDLGEQYLSAIFYYDQQQKQIAEQLLQQLRDKGYTIATRLLPVTTFWPAEDYHQDYYHKTGKAPYCHSYTKRF